MANGKNLTEAPTLMFEFIGTGDAASYFLYFPSDISSYLRLYISCSSLLFVSNICRYYRNHIHSPVSSILFGYRILMLSVATRHRKWELLPSNTLNHFFPFLYLLEAYTREQTQIVQQIASKHNGSDFMFAEEPEAKKELWKVILCPTPNTFPVPCNLPA